MAFQPCNFASADLWRQLSVIPSSTACGQRQYPCGARLKDGTIIDRVLFLEEAHGLYNRSWVPLESIAEVWDSPLRMPVHLAQKLYAAGESGMGYLIYRAITNTGQEFVNLTGSIVDFPGLPEGVMGTDIVDVYPHEGRDPKTSPERIPHPPVREAHFVRPRSGLDVGCVTLEPPISIEEIVAAIREGRERG